MADLRGTDSEGDEECPGRVTIEEDGSEEWVVQKIISKKKERGNWMYEIKWHGWPSRYNSWEPISNLKNCKEKLVEFEREWKQNQKKAAARGSTRKNEETVNLKNEQGEQGEARVAGTSRQLDVDLKEPVEENHVDNEEPLRGFSEEIRELDKMWLGSHFKMFRREWRPTEEPICVLASAVVNDALLHMVKIKCPTDPENVMYNPEESVTENNCVLVLSTMFRKKFPQLLIAYYQSRLMLLEELKSDENLLKDAARAGLVHNLLGAKVEANYRQIFRDMMPPGQDYSSDDDSCEQISNKQPKGEDELKKIEGVKDAKDPYGLPFYYCAEGEGTFGSDDEMSSDDDEDWEEVKRKGNRSTKKKRVGNKE